MTGVEDFLLIGVAFVALAWLTHRRASRVGLVPLKRLASVFLLVGIVGLLAPLTDLIGRVAIVSVFAGLMLYPLALLRFVDALAPVRRLVRQIAGAGAIMGFVLIVAFAVVGEGSPVVRGLGGLESTVLLPALIVLAHVVSWRAIAGQAHRLHSSFTVRRARAMNGGLTAVGLGIVAGLKGPLDLGILLAFLAAVALAFAAAPPRWLRTVWLMPDLDVVDEAEADYLSHPGDPAALRAYVEAVNRVVDGLSTWVVKDGQVIAEVGESAPTDLRLQQPWDGHRALERLPDGRWLVQARTRGVVLRVLTADDPVLFGLSESTLFDRVAARLAVALEREQYEDEHRQVALLMQEAAHLRRIADLKDDVLSTVSHELRTPLTVIGGNTELLLGRWHDLSDEDRKNLVARVQVHAAMLTRNVEDTLRLASLRAGQVPVRPREVDLRTLVENWVRPLGGDGRVVVDVPDLRVVLDDDLVGDVVARLVSNGLKHASGEVTVRAEADGQDLVIRVADDGPGFIDLHPEDLFTPFVRGGNVLVRTTRGLGVGLAVVAATAAVIDGEVTVESHAGAGATVRFDVPRCVVGVPQPVE